MTKAKEPGDLRYSAEVHEKIVTNLRAGALKKHAANAAGVSDRTFHRWLQWGAEGREPFARFAYDVEVTIAQTAVRDQAIITKAAAGEHAGDWKAAAWNLERKFPKLYGQLAAGHELPTSSGKPFSPWKQPAGAETTRADLPEVH